MNKKIHRFSVPVNCSQADHIHVTETLQATEKLYEDSGLILLPEEYTPTGKATRLVINCHGAGGSVSTDDSQAEHQVLTQYLLANGYAVMDVNGLPLAYAEEQGIDIRNNIGSPIAIQSYVKAYHYCMDHFNLKPDVFVHGSSMGGISSTNLVLSGSVPVIAHTAFCPVLDTYHQIFLHPWSGGLPKIALGKLYRLDTDENGEYVYDESKIAGYNPIRNKKIETYPVPVKCWHCVDDWVVSCAITEQFVCTIRENGGRAELRRFPTRLHTPSLVGNPIERPCGRHIYDGNPLEIRPAVEEAFIFIRNFD